MTSNFPLSELQNWMQSALIAPQNIADDDTLEVLKSNQRISARQGLEIYQRSYIQRISSCMREQFPALCYALGEELFNDFVAEYIAKAPPESYTLYDLGRRFAQFLQSSRPDNDVEAIDKEPWIDFMIDLANFERHIFTTFDCEGIEGKPLATQDIPDNKLRVQPSLSVGSYRFPVARYYHEIRDGKKPALPPARQIFVAILRKNYQTITMSLNEPHYLFLDQMCNGSGVEDALQYLAKHYQADPEAMEQSWRDARKIRNDWIAAGFFIVG